MCRFASFVLTKTQAFWLATEDSHEAIIREHKLHADGARGPNILRVELVPGAKVKKWPQFKDWDFHIDQDIMPEWFDKGDAEKRTRAACAERFQQGFLTVYAIGCTALTELEAPEAKTVYASGCTALTELEAPKADYVYAIGCTALKNKPKRAR
jgi:hypothetical protein